MSRLDNMNLSAQKWLGGKIVLHTAIQEGRDVIIIVTKALWDRSIDSCLKILCSDLRNEGFSVVIATVDAHIGSGWVRNFLQEMRNSNERGPSQFLIIVGQIDVPWFGFRNLNWKNVPPFQNDPDHTEYFPSDFYYADLTGSWNNHFPLHANPQSECYGALAWNELWDSLGKPYLSREHYQPASADYVMWFREELGYDPTGTNWGWELSSGDKAHNRICAYPDMAVGRIDPTPITAIGWDGAQHNPIVDLDLQEQLIFAYFSRNHQYRTGQLEAPHHSMLFAGLGDGVYAGDIIESKIGSRFQDNLLLINRDDSPSSGIISIAEWASANRHALQIDNYFNISGLTLNHQSFLDQLSYGYHLVEVSAHGGAATVGLPEDFSIHELNRISSKSLFYVLSSCFSGQIAFKDNIATAFLFNGLGLAVICSSVRYKLHSQTLYEQLMLPHCIGSAHKQNLISWIKDTNLDNQSFRDPWNAYGNMLLGDPTLRIRNI